MSRSYFLHAKLHGAGAEWTAAVAGTVGSSRGQVVVMTGRDSDFSPSECESRPAAKQRSIHGGDGGRA